MCVCVQGKGGREAAQKPGNRQPFTVWGHPGLTFRGKIHLEEEVSQPQGHQAWEGLVRAEPWSNKIHWDPYFSTLTPVPFLRAGRERELKIIESFPSLFPLGAEVLW